MKLYQLIETSSGNVIGEVLLSGDVVALKRTELSMMSGTHYLAEVSETNLDLDGLKALYNRQIDLFAGGVRNRFISRGDGIEMTYLQKLEEAKAFAAAGYVGTETEYPFLFKEATATDSTATDVANLILGSFSAWRDIGSTIEAQRQRAHRLIGLATTEAAAKSEKELAIGALNANG